MTAAGILLEMTLLLVAVSSLPARGQIMLSGNENKIDLTTGGQTVIPNAAPDSLTLIDFSKYPPVTVDVMDVPNTVIGPPSNIAISPDGRLAAGGEARFGSTRPAERNTCRSRTYTSST